GRSSSGHRLTSLAFAFSLGIVIGQYQSQPIASAWLTIAGLLVLLAALPCIHRRISAAHLLILAMIALGAAWYTIRTEYVAPNDLAALLGESQLVQITGITEAGPTLLRRTSASLADFDYRGPST